MPALIVIVVRLFQLTTSRTVMPYLRAMSVIVSPLCTVWYLGWLTTVAGLVCTAGVTVVLAVLTVVAGFP